MERSRARPATEQPSVAAVLSDPWVAAWRTEGPRTSGGTAGGVMLANAAITRLVEEVGLPLGTPVVVRA